MVVGGRVAGPTRQFHGKPRSASTIGSGASVLSSTTIRQDRAAYDLPPGDPRPALRARPLVLAAPEVAFFNLPQLTEDQPAHRPFLAAHARP